MYEGRSDSDMDDLSWLVHQAALSESTIVSAEKTVWKS